MACLPMLADNPLQREDARPTVLAGPGRLAHLRERARSVVNGSLDGFVVDGLALTDDHKDKVRLNLSGVESRFEQRDCDRSNAGEHAVASGHRDAGQLVLPAASFRA